MPTWLVHGFRWPRAQVRIHVIVQNLDDAAPEWLMAPATTACLTENFKTQYPEQMAQLPDLRFIEQYDPDDLHTKDQPYAYVCDIVQEIKLGIEVDEARGAGLGEEQWAAIAEIRDKVAPGEKLGWFVVVNGDVERWAPPLSDDDDTTPDASHFGATSQRSSIGKAAPVQAPSPEPERPSTSRSLKKWFGGLRKTKSAKDLRGEAAISTDPVPPLPPISPRHGLKSLSSSNGFASSQSKNGS
ncbi:developmental regulator [Pyrenophora seminiperda CCB06]|uniref:Developmental regulator n=1 Tax=Pyrenophora seminiperda CCB06 TaxID=1302712 RepID=A0A3M7LV82_9PLEO|nr:developmental regulator [Pyrenophora seminiperda CCB06]